jgi:hypothetical protein
MSDEETFLYPIIYVRGFAMSQTEIDETTADPFCGFNIGATVFRATTDRTKPPRKYIFESPLVRLGTDFGYTDVYKDGKDIVDDDWTGSIPKKSVVIYRYYDPASNLLGGGKTPPMEDFAKGLSKLILRMRELVCQDPKNAMTPDKFRCYLVAHSMGGLVCRAFLQNRALGDDAARKCVEKAFTYATPHNGIEMGGINVPSWFGAGDAANFNRERMAEYLDLTQEYAKTGRVDWLPERDGAFPVEKFFCLIGTNRTDYEVAAGLSRTFAGNGSDGLVRIENALVSGIKDGQPSDSAAKAFVYRSHSGYFGIVNSEESYQNLVRFLFGDIRADIWLDIDDIRLPDKVQEEQDAGNQIDALYQFEVLASPRGKLWYLSRRTSEEDSVACLSHKDWVKSRVEKPVSLYVSSIFLAKRARINKDSPSLAYSMAVGVRVPDYEVQRKLWVNEHFEGAYIFRDAVVIEIVPPEQDGGVWRITYDWQSIKPGVATTPLIPTTLPNGKLELLVPFVSETAPGIRGKLRFVVSEWNVGD